MPITNNPAKPVRSKPAVTVTLTAENDRKRASYLADKLRQAKPEQGFMHHAIAALPIIATNATAVVFQISWAHEALASWGNTGAVLYAACVESVAISVAYHAHRAEIKNLRSGTLRLASILIGIGVGILNASHHMHQLPLAGIAFGCSAISPWLWHMFSKQVSSETLAKNGQLDYAPIRLGLDRWLYHPVRSWQVKRDSAWSGQRNIQLAIREHDNKLSEKAARMAAEKARATMDAELEKITR